MRRLVQFLLLQDALFGRYSETAPATTTEIPIKLPSVISGDNSLCPYRCNCTGSDDLKLNCKNVDLKSFPRILLKGTTVANLWLISQETWTNAVNLFKSDTWNSVHSLAIHGSIHTIHRNFFVGLENLQNLTISRSNLSVIHNETFARFGRLVNLDLSFNKNLSYSMVLECMPGFKHKQLKTLILVQINQNHRPRWLNEDFYRSFRNISIQVLNLAASNILVIKPGMKTTFKNLKLLNISYNLIIGDPAAFSEVITLPEMEIIDISYVSNFGRKRNDFSIPGDGVTRRRRQVHNRLFVDESRRLRKFQNVLPIRNGTSRKQIQNEWPVRRVTYEQQVQSRWSVARATRRRRTIANGWAVWLSINIKCVPMTPNLKEVHFHHIGSPIPIDLLETYCFDPRNKLRVLLLNHWGFRKLNCSFTNLKYLEHLDLSNNRLEYFDQKFFSLFPRLNILDLSNNHLWKMNRHYATEFSTLFRSNSNLENLDISNNFLKSIPSDMFKTNENLKYLDLSGNALESAAFTLPKNSKIKTINLSNNKLHTIDSSFLTILNNILFLRYKVHGGSDRETNPLDGFSNSSKYTKGDNSTKQNTINRQELGNASLTLDISRNQISCDCINAHLMKWASQTRVILIDKLSVTCSENHTLASALSQVVGDGDSCDDDFILLIVSIVIGTLLSCAVAMTCYCVRRCRMKKRPRNLKYRYVSFIAYSHHDKEFVLRDILPSLEERLAKALGKTDELVGINDRDFELGHCIDEEIYRCVKSSLVIILVISNSFLESRWCEFETYLAWRKRKPIFLLFRHEVEKKKIPRILRYDHLTRLVWPQKESNRENFWQVLCRSIINIVPEPQPSEDSDIK